MSDELRLFWISKEAWGAIFNRMPSKREKQVMRIQNPVDGTVEECEVVAICTLPRPVDGRDVPLVYVDDRGS